MEQRGREKKEESAVAEGQLLVRVLFRRPRSGFEAPDAFEGFYYSFPLLAKRVLELERSALRFWARSRGRSRRAVKIGGPKGENSVVFTILVFTGVVYYAVGGRA